MPSAVPIPRLQCPETFSHPLSTNAYKRVQVAIRSPPSLPPHEQGPPSGAVRRLLCKLSLFGIYIFFSLSICIIGRVHGYGQAFDARVRARDVLHKTL